MAKREKHKAKALDHEEEEEEREEEKKAERIASDDDDDEEANEDLTLKIVEKSIQLRATAAVNSANESEIEKSGDFLKGNIDSGGVNVELSSKTDVCVVGDSSKKKVKKVIKKKVKKKKKPLIENVDNGEQNQSVVEVGKEQKEKKEVIVEIVQSADPDSNAVQISDNLVMRKLLRGPRYFDPPDSGGWETCFNCGEEGHMSVNCTVTKRKKPCFVCGSLEHGVKQCHKAQECYICKKCGHRAKDCPEKHRSGSHNDKICLKCLGFGHDMLACKHDYSPEDLKEIQCYVCKSFGHLCCITFVDTSQREPSCYKCGQLGHTGLACGRLRMEDTGLASPSSCYKCGEGGHFARECRSSAKSKRLCGETTEKQAKKLRGETTGIASPSSCFKCGKEGHWVRGCPSSAKVGIGKSSRELSTPAQKSRRVNKDHLRFKSAPHDLGKVHRRKKTQLEDAWITTAQKSRRRGDWIMDDPGDFSDRKLRNNRGRSPATPFKEHYKGFSASRYVSSSASSRIGSSNHRFSASKFGNSNGFSVSRFSNSDEFSASRFSNSIGDDKRRNYNWW